MVMVHPLAWICYPLPIDPCALFFEALSQRLSVWPLLSALSRQPFIRPLHKGPQWAWGTRWGRMVGAVCMGIVEHDSDSP